MDPHTLSLGTKVLLAAVSNLWLIASFRAVPFAVYTLARRGLPLHARVGALLLYGCMLMLAGRPALEALPWWLIGFAYYALCACGIHWMTSGGGEIRGFHAGLLLCMAFGTFLFVPSAVFPGVAVATFGVLGWELALKAYSYGLEPASSRGDLASCLFFFLVDPSVVFPQRAYELEPARQRLGPAARRAGQGLLALLFGMLLLDAISESRLHAGQAVLMLLAQYGLHSGLASLQIALMRASGYGVAERYHHPLLARSPADFWSRWNTYVGQWARRYIYSPLAYRIARRQGNVPR